MSTDLIVSLVGIVLGSNLIVEFFKWLTALRDTPTKKMLRALGSDKLEEKLKKWKHSDERTADEWENIEQLYEGYIALGGNGSIKKLYLECKEIETTE